MPKMLWKTMACATYYSVTTDSEMADYDLVEEQECLENEEIDPMNVSKCKHKWVFTTEAWCGIPYGQDGQRRTVYRK